MALGNVRVAFARYCHLEEDRPLTVFDIPSRWGVSTYCRIWRIQITNSGRRPIGQFHVLLSGYGNRRRLPFDRQRLGFLESEAACVDLERRHSVTVEVAFTSDSKAIHHGFETLGPNEMGICALDVKPPGNVMHKRWCEAVLEIQGHGIRPVVYRIDLYPNEYNDLVMLRRRHFPFGYFQQKRLRRLLRARESKNALRVPEQKHNEGT